MPIITSHVAIIPSDIVILSYSVPVNVVQGFMKTKPRFVLPCDAQTTDFSGSVLVGFEVEDLSKHYIIVTVTAQSVVFFFRPFLCPRMTCALGFVS
jgi:hypothetical protein